MTVKTMNFARGIAVGMAAGAAVGLAVRPNTKRRRAVKAVRAVSKMAENIAESLWG